MNIKEKIDIIAKKLDIVKSKAIGFMAIAGGSWVYAIEPSDKPQPNHLKPKKW